MTLADQVLEIRGWQEHCKFLQEWQSLPRQVGWVDYADFDPTLIKTDIARITLIDATLPNAPTVLIRGEILNHFTGAVRKGDGFMDHVAPAAQDAIRHMLETVTAYPCFAVHDVAYRMPDGANVATGETVVLPFRRKSRNQTLVMCCTRIDEVRGPSANRAPLQIDISRLAYFNYGFGGPEPDGGQVEFSSHCLQTTTERRSA